MIKESMKSTVNLRAKSRRTGKWQEKGHNGKGAEREKVGKRKERKQNGSRQAVREAKGITENKRGSYKIYNMKENERQKEFLKKEERPGRKEGCVKCLCVSCENCK